MKYVPMKRVLVAAAVGGSFLLGSAFGIDGVSAGPNDPSVGRASMRVVDMTQPISPDMPIWPGDPAVEFDDLAQIPTDGYFLRGFGMGEHSGTHLNAANSFVEGGRSIDQYTGRELVVPAVVIDVRNEVSRNADYALTIDKVRQWERRNGQIRPGSVVLLRTGWEDRWSDPAAFFNEDADGALHFPGFAGDTTRWLYDQRRIGGVGIDTHGVDPGLDESFATNVLTAERSKIALECLNNIDSLPATGATLVIGPTKLVGGSGAPASVTALVPR